jgi:hemerythrin-like domain-containing protein
MKRDPRLQGLSSDHHQALVLARRIRRRATAGTLDAELARGAVRQFQSDVEPHFVVEEEVLLPALAEVGEDGLVQRTIEDHTAMKALMEAVAEGDLDPLTTFADRLVAHVRFEERILFPACEKKLSDSVLEEAARRAPHPPSD